MSSTSDPLDLVGELRDLVDRLLAVDPGSLAPDAAGVLALGVIGERDRLTVAVGDVLHAWDGSGVWAAGGTLRASRALGRDTRRCDRGAAVELRRARMLMDMPHTRAAVLAGRLSIDHVDLFLRYATPARWDRFLADEELLVGLCAAADPFDMARRLMRYWAQRVDDELDLARDTPPPSTVSFSRTGDTGEGVLSGVLSPIHAEIVDNELRRLMADIKREDDAKGIVRTVSQRRALAMVRMASRSVNATGVTARPLFQIIVGDDTARRLCELASDHVVHPDDLEPYIDSAVIESFLFDGSYTVIAKTKQRTFTGALRKAIQVRDRRCQHPSGCATPARDADVDHYRPASQGGETSQFNGRVECIPHNRLAHLHDHPHERGDPDAHHLPGHPERPITDDDVARARMRWRLARRGWSIIELQRDAA